MLRNGLLSVIGIGLLSGSITVGSAVAQEAPVDTPADAPPAETTPNPEPPVSEPAAAEPGEPADTEPATPDSATPEAEPDNQPDDTSATDPAAPSEEASDPQEAESASDESEEAPSTDGDAEEAEDAGAGTDWAALVEGAPEFLALTHHAAVHLPIALWLFGAFFVVVGVVAPSLRNQIPLACLIGGAVTSIGAAASGWWYAEHEYGDSWDWETKLGDIEWSDLLTQHRWMGVALVLASCVLSVLAIISVNRQRGWKLAWFWRLGLIALAAAVAFEGHIGGELIHGEGFLEEAFQEWVAPDVE